jgi:Flp pilus assembly protein TadG
MDPSVRKAAMEFQGMPRLTRKIKSLSRDRKGGILSLTAIMLPVFILIAALCVDLGMLYLAKTKAEIAATAAAEAAVQRLPDIASAQTLANQVALAMLDDAGFVSDHNIEVSVSADNVVVNVHLRVTTVLAHFADVDFLDADARVQRSSP